MRPEETEVPCRSPAVYPWVPDQGDGTYCNPVLLADYSDPDIVRHGPDFYLVASSFNCTPGLPILHSRDLVNWTIINHAIKNVPGERYRDVQHGAGVWAPSIRFHEGKFWIFFPTPDEGIYVTTAVDPAGAWSEPHRVVEGEGLIDPCPLWDDDGQAYLVYAYASSRAGIKNRLRVSPMAPDGSRLLGEGHIVYHEPERHPTLEGPKFLKKDGWYYLFAPAGGVKTGWQVVFRSRHVYGPYEDKIVLAQGATPINGPHQGGIVELHHGGEWWFVHFQDAGVYGRIVHLQPVEWRDEWPVIGIDREGDGTGEPVRRWRKPSVGGEYPTKAPIDAAARHFVIPQTSDSFDSGELGRQWQWHANHEDAWCSLRERRGYLRLVSQPVLEGNFANAPNLLLQKFPARVFTVETSLEFFPRQVGEQAGLIVMGHAHASLALQHTEQGSRIVFHSDNTQRYNVAAPGNAVKLRVEVREGGLCTFAYAPPDGAFVSIGEPFPAREGHWIGAKVGIYSLVQDNRGSAGYTDFDFFRFHGVDLP